MDICGEVFDWEGCVFLGGALFFFTTLTSPTISFTLIGILLAHLPSDYFFYLMIKTESFSSPYLYLSFWVVQCKWTTGS